MENGVLYQDRDTWYVLYIISQKFIGLDYANKWYVYVF